MIRKFSLSLLALGLTALVSVPVTAHAQTAQVSQKPKLTTLHRFGYDIHGVNPISGLTLGKDGNFYGTTFGTTTLYKMTPDGLFTTLHRFTGAEGGFLITSLTQGADGAFYGVAKQGGSNNFGTAFRMTTNGRFKLLHTFAGTDGALPDSQLLQARDGSFYGTTVAGGDKDNGTLFRMTTDGAVTTLHAFRDSDGIRPLGSLAFGPEGAIYGRTYRAGTHGVGTLYRLKPDGTSFQVLHNFTGVGAFDFAGLTAGPDGAIYGVTVAGDSSDAGVAYKITPSGQFTTLHKFSNDGHGKNPIASLTLGTDGSFYGTTTYGGTTSQQLPNGGGTVFVMTPSGQVTTLYKFHTTFDGFGPEGSVTLGPDGALYGTTNGGGAKSYGTIYKLTLPK